ncbi:PDZ domain-containing protein [Akkermansiaceae bacterium]|nr:PDZ domain-containing protein [Akkermansiaceae bacterium]
MKRTLIALLLSLPFSAPLLFAEPSIAKLKKRLTAMINGCPVPSSGDPNYRIGVFCQPDSALIVSGTIEESAARDAEITRGDRILAINGIKVSNVDSLRSIISAAGPQELSLTVRRDDKEIRVKVTPKMDRPKFRDVILELEVIPMISDDGSQVPGVSVVPTKEE